MAGDYNSMEHENSRFNGDNTLPENDVTYFKCYGEACGSFAYEKIVNTKLVPNIQENLTTQEDICMMTQHGIISL